MGRPDRRGPQDGRRGGSESDRRPLEELPHRGHHRGKRGIRRDIAGPIPHRHHADDPGGWIRQRGTIEIRHRAPAGQGGRNRQDRRPQHLAAGIMAHHRSRRLAGRRGREDQDAPIGRRHRRRGHAPGGIELPDQHGHLAGHIVVETHRTRGSLEPDHKTIRVRPASRRHSHAGHRGAEGHRLRRKIRRRIGHTHDEPKWRRVQTHRRERAVDDRHQPGPEWLSKEPRPHRGGRRDLDLGIGRGRLQDRIGHIVDLHGDRSGAGPGDPADEGVGGTPGGPEGEGLHDALPCRGQDMLDQGLQGGPGVAQNLDMIRGRGAVEGRGRHDILEPCRGCGAEPREGRQSRSHPGGVIVHGLARGGSAQVERHQTPPVRIQHQSIEAGRVEEMPEGQARDAVLDRPGPGRREVPARGSEGDPDHTRGLVGEDHVGPAVAVDIGRHPEFPDGLLRRDGGGETRRVQARHDGRDDGTGQQEGRSHGTVTGFGTRMMSRGSLEFGSKRTSTYR